MNHFLPIPETLRKLRQLDPEVTRKRNLNHFAYSIVAQAIISSYSYGNIRIQVGFMLIHTTCCQTIDEVIDS